MSSRELREPVSSNDLATNVSSTNWTEVVVPVGAADVDDVAALIASEVVAAAAGTEQRGDVVDVSSTDRNDDLDPISQAEASESEPG